MPIIRTKHNADNPYFMLNRHCIQNSKLSTDARAVHCYLMSLPDDWVIRITHLVTQFPEGEYTIRKALKELEKHGYLQRERIYENGRIVRWEIVALEVPEGETPRYAKVKQEDHHNPDNWETPLGCGLTIDDLI